jgi:hypothetical protein
MVHRGGGLKRMKQAPYPDAFALLRDLADHFKPLREHLVERADGEGIELFWDAIEAIRALQSGPPNADVAAGGDR